MKALLLSIFLIVCCSSQCFSQRHLSFEEFQRLHKRNSEREAKGKQRRNEALRKKQMLAFNKRVARKHKTLVKQSRNTFGRERTWNLVKLDAQLNASIGMAKGNNIALWTRHGALGSLDNPSDFRPEDIVYLNLLRSWEKQPSKKAKDEWIERNSHLVGRERSVIERELRLTPVTANLDSLENYEVDIRQAQGTPLEKLLQMASLPYLSDGKRIGWEIDAEFLTRVVEKGDENLRQLARLILLREFLRLDQNDAKKKFGERYKKAAQMAQKAIGESAVRQGYRYVVGEDHTFENEISDFVSILSTHVSIGVDAEKFSWETRRDAWVFSAMINQQVLSLIKPQKTSPFDKNRFKIDHSELFAIQDNAHLLHEFTNKGQPLERVVLFVEMDCSYENDPGHEQLEEMGQLFFNLITGGNAPDYTGRNNAVESYFDSNKAFLLYIPKFSGEVKLPTLLLNEVLASVNSIRITILNENAKTILQVPKEEFEWDQFDLLKGIY